MGLILTAAYRILTSFNPGPSQQLWLPGGMDIDENVSARDPMI